ncbi:MAG: 50S ribosomal protein L25 [Planctomycetota bacterium]
MATPTLKARPRTDAEHGSRACRKLRSAGEIPVNLYKATKAEGQQTQLENHNVAVSAFDMVQLITKDQRIIDLHLGGKVELVRVTEVQRDQFGDDVLHVDMRAIDPSVPVEAETPIAFTGRPAGLKDASLLAIEARSMKVRCKPREIPESVSVDLTPLASGQALLTKDLTLPAGVEAVDPERVVARVNIKGAAAAAAPEEAAS